MRDRRLPRLAAGFFVLGVVSGIQSVALAQAAPTAPTPAAAGQPPAPTTTPLPVSACVPDCRAGFVCLSGQCVSACNPPCAANEQCTVEARCVATVTAATPNAAAPAAPTPPAVGAYPAEPPPPPEPVPSDRVERHDGFYLRAALGLGKLFGKSEPDVDSDLEFSVSGLAGLFELALGGTPAPGIVIGGGIFTSSVSETSYEIDVDGESEEFEASGSTVGLLGPFIDVYPNPEHGFHVQGSIGFGVITADEDDEYLFDNYGGVGLGLMAGIGYEAWVADQWSLGGLIRVIYANATMTAENDDFPDMNASMLVPGILFTATYH
jgi:hypothetical protein